MATAFGENLEVIDRRTDALLADARTYLDALQQQANVGLVSGSITLPSPVNYSVPNTHAFTSFALRPTLTGLNLAAPPDAPAVSFSSVSPIALPADDLLTPTSVFAFYEGLYESTLLDPLKAKLLNDLVNGGYGIDTNDEIALFNRARDREVEAALTRIEEAGSAMARRGFPLPPGELSVHVDRAWQDMQNKVSGAARDITLQRSKLFVENRQFTIQEVRQLETVLIGFHNSVQERALNVARATAEFGIAIYNTLLARFKLRLDAAKISSEVNIAQANVDVAQAQAKFEIFRSQVLAYEANLRRTLDPARLQVDLYRADVDASRGYNEAQSARAALRAKVIDATVQQNLQVGNQTIESARVLLSGTVAELQFRTEAAKFGSQVFFAQLSALLSTVNALMVESSST